MIFGLHDEFILLNEKSLRVLKSYLEDKDAILEDLLLAVSIAPLDEILEEDKRYFRRIMEYWEEGYAIPVSSFEELKRIKTGDASIESFRNDVSLSLFGEEIAVEPDVNYKYAKEFVNYIDSAEILDIASGFGWIPPLFSKRGRVLALDNSYTKKIFFDRDGKVWIEGTNIELFPDWPEAKEFLRENRAEFQIYKDFAQLFWESQGADIGKITFLQGNAGSMNRCYDLSHRKEFEIYDGSVEYVTCFFGFNHISTNFREVLREISRVLARGGKALVTLYNELLEKFPVKFSYTWVEELEIKMINLREFKKNAEKLGFNIELLKGHSGEKLYYLLLLIKR
jgi:SAM-dependent methyltransferase